MSALVRRYCNRLHIFLNCGVDNLMYGPIMPEVNDLRARFLDNAAHDVNRRVVSVEQRPRREDADFVFRGVGLNLFHF